MACIMVSILYLFLPGSKNIRIVLIVVINTVDSRYLEIDGKNSSQP
jgi:hypothetical protein